MILETILLTLIGVTFFLTILIFRMAKKVNENKCCDHQDKYNHIIKNIDRIKYEYDFWGKEIIKLSGNQYNIESSLESYKEKMEALILYLNIQYIGKSLIEKEAHFKQCEKVEG